MGCWLITREMMDAEFWYGSKHPINLGPENILEKTLRITGFNQLNPRLSDEKILREYRKHKVREELRKEHEGKPFYELLRGIGVGTIANYFIDRSNTLVVKFRVDRVEEGDKIAYDVIAMIPYTR